MARHIEFLGTLQSLFHFSGSIDIELRAKTISGLPSRRLHLGWRDGALLYIQ